MLRDGLAGDWQQSPQVSVQQVAVIGEQVIGHSGRLGMAGQGPQQIGGDVLPAAALAARQEHPGQRTLIA